MNQTCTVDKELFIEILLQCKKYKHKQFKNTFNQSDIDHRKEYGLLKSDRWLVIEKDSVHMKHGV